ncbi:hypothetical protein Tco_1230896 [Tanacetum coccineum]
MELALEQTQQGTSYEVSVSAEGVEELKRKVKIKDEKKEALLTLWQKPGQYICCQESKRWLLTLKTDIMDLVQRIENKAKKVTDMSADMSVLVEVGVCQYEVRVQGIRANDWRGD